MKKILLLTTLLLFSVFSFSQDDRSIVPILAQVAEVTVKMEEKGFEIVKIECDIVGLQNPKTSYRVLSPLWVYTVGVLGDYRSIDMDIEVYKQHEDGTYQLVASDSKESNFATVSVQPTEECWYKFVIKCHSMKANYIACHYGLIVLHY